MSSLGFVTGFCCKLHDARSDGRVLGSGDHRPSHRPPDYRPVYSAQSGAGALVPITEDSEVRGLGLGVFKARARAPWGLGDYFSISISMHMHPRFLVSLGSPVSCVGILLRARVLLGLPRG